MGNHEQISNTNSFKTTDVYSTDHPELYGYSDEQQLSAIDPKYANDVKYEEMAIDKLGELPPGQLPRSSIIRQDKKTLDQISKTPKEKHRYEQSMAKGKPWDDKYKDHQREKIGNLMEDPVGQEEEEQFNPFEDQDSKAA